MRRLFRTTLNVALMLAPFVGNGCATQSLQMKNAQQQAPQDPQKVTAQQLLVAQREEARGNLVEARKLYTRIHQANPDHAECAHRLGLLYVKLNLHSEAEVFYRKALEISPNDSRILADIGHLAFLNKDYAQSEDYLVRATNADSTNRTATYNLAVVRAWMEDDESSLATFRNINDEPDALRNLATIQIARGDKSLGLNSMRRAEIATETMLASKTSESNSSSTQLVSAKVPDFASAATQLKPVPDSVSSLRHQPYYPTSNSAKNHGQNDSFDIPPAPAILPSQTASALSSLRSSSKAVACFDAPSSSAVANYQPKATIVIPEFDENESPEPVLESDQTSFDQLLDERQFELPYRSSLQIDFPDEDRLSWETLKKMEIMQVK